MYTINVNTDNLYKQGWYDRKLIKDKLLNFTNDSIGCYYTEQYD